MYVEFFYMKTEYNTRIWQAEQWVVYSILYFSEQATLNVKVILLYAIIFMFIKHFMCLFENPGSSLF